MPDTKNVAAVAPVNPRIGASGRNTKPCITSRNARFHLRPQNSLADRAVSGLSMMCRALTPNERQASDSKCDTPKCNTETKPIIATHPATYGCESINLGAKPTSD